MNKYTTLSLLVEGAESREAHRGVQPAPAGPRWPPSAPVGPSDREGPGNTEGTVMTRVSRDIQRKSRYTETSAGWLEAECS